jgi:3',5'-nucleoside bisphosphate phosphatase
MRFYKADLHIHTLLSPCGSLEMSPANIIAKAKEKKLDIIGITDHNSTRHCRLIQKMAAREGITVFCGAEVTTREEVHCLAFFDNNDSLDAFQHFLEKQLPPVKNDVHRFGYQVVIDEEENIIDEEEHLLITGLHADLETVNKKVHNLGGIFIPAHVDRAFCSLISQLGFIPPDIEADALEISRFMTVDELITKHKIKKNFTFLRSSDAHMPEEIGRSYSQLWLEAPSLEEFRMALKNENGRFVKTA